MSSPIKINWKGESVLNKCICKNIKTYNNKKQVINTPVERGHTKKFYPTTHMLVMLKILQARLQQHMNHEFPDVQAGFKKAKEPEIKLPTSIGSSKQ